VFELVRANAIEEVVALVDSRAIDVDLADARGNTVLMASCAAGHRRMTKQLLKRGAGVNRRNAEGDTPLHFCVAGGHVELGEYLLGKGADERAVNARGVKPFGG
jgi:ankyrin repeat protein|tara:strand:+ start:253 stop:564 length:312 start_codon:yes stop_codon:yes gene_type:complete